eukprot:2710367-Amphidinium_carterae.1
MLGYTLEEIYGLLLHKQQHLRRHLARDVGAKTTVDIERRQTDAEVSAVASVQNASPERQRCSYQLHLALFSLPKAEHSLLWASSNPPEKARDFVLGGYHTTRLAPVSTQVDVLVCYVKSCCAN